MEITTPMPRYKFGSIREHVLQCVWIAETDRKLWQFGEARYKKIAFDDYSNSYENKWQSKAIAIPRADATSGLVLHVPHFCSLGDWARNITDVLTDERYDDLSFDDATDRGYLFRYYTRLLLIVSEILADCEKLLAATKLEKSTNMKANRELLSSRVDIDQLMHYVNKVCKHKDDAMHGHNHHIKFWFADSGDECPFREPISLTQPTPHKTSSPDGLSIPALEDIIYAVTDSYQALDRHFSENPDKFEKFCLSVGAEYPIDELKLRQS